MSQSSLAFIRKEFQALVSPTESVRIQAILPQRGTPVDATSKYVVETKSLGTFFVIVSAASYPRTVAQAIRKQEGVRAILGLDLGCVIETPTLHGFAEGVSYAIWPFRRPLSGNRMLSKLQRLWLSPRLCRWLGAVTRATAHPASLSTYDNAIRHFLARVSLPQPLAEAGHRALRDLHEGSLRPFHVLQHGDFWHGNVLLRGWAGPPAQLNPWGFYLIDWGGAEEEGFPFFDLLKITSSLGFSPAQLAKEVERHSRILGIEPVQALSYFLVGLAHLGTHLENFPEDRYLALGLDLHARLTAAG